MKAVLITTTINVPEVLRVYRAASKETPFIITGDRKTPHDAVRAFCAEIGNARYYSDEDQEKLGYRCSPFIGWNCIMRRSVALLEALKLRPDYIITIDDDNIPVDPRFYFPAFGLKLNLPHQGLTVRGKDGWFNVGDFFSPPVAHRGFPFFDLPHGFEVVPGGGIDVGLVGGLWYGDPDISAAERLIKKPNVIVMSNLLEGGVAVEAGTFAPVNSQNTAYKFEFAPLFAYGYSVGRYDDIFASLIAQRIMWEHGHHVLYGPPFVWQERNEQSIHTNLENEVFGMRHVTELADFLRGLDLGQGSPVEMLGRVWSGLQGLYFLPRRYRAFGLAWLRDLEKVL